jgi:hypothetical protein
MSSGSLAGGIGVWGASLRPVGFGWQAGIMAAPELWALLLALWGWRRGWRLGTPGLRPAGVPGGLRCCVGISAPRSLGLAAGLASGDTRPSARGCPRRVALLRGGFLLLALWVGGGVGVWGHPAFGLRVSPVGGVAAWGISFPPSLLPSFFPSKQVNYE